jgi:hypothetical protein
MRIGIVGRHPFETLIIAIEPLRPAAVPPRSLAGGIDQAARLNHFQPQGFRQ